MATALPTVYEIIGVAGDEGLVVVGSGATETVRSPEVLQSDLSSTHGVMPDAKVEIDVEAGRADGTTTGAYSLVGMQTPRGWFRRNVIVSTGVPMLLNLKKSLWALQAAIDLSMSTVTNRCTDCRGHPLWEPSDAETGRRS